MLKQIKKSCKINLIKQTHAINLSEHAAFIYKLKQKAKSEKKQILNSEKSLPIIFF